MDLHKNKGEVTVVIDLSFSAPIDESFGITDDREPGFRLDREVWPHGQTGAAMAHGAIYWPAADPDWKIVK